MKAAATQYKELTRGAVEVIDAESLRQRLQDSLQSGRPLRVKVGFDPSVPDLHLGHTVLLQKMRQFQDLGHEVLFLIGDFTGMIGDPSGKNVTRPPLSRDEINQNATTYKEQVFKVLDAKKTHIEFNSRWLDKLASVDFIKLAAMETVARMLERDDFHKRYKEGKSISIHEFLYPLMQGYDSVALKADIELGGTDQRFNLLMGRQIQKEFKQKPQDIMMMPLLVGTDGAQKMSKSLNNYIGITEPPEEIYGKIMSISDDLMWNYYELLSSKSLKQIKAMQKQVETGKLHPKQAKSDLASELTARYWEEEAAKQAANDFDKKFRQHQAPEELPTITLKPEPIGLITLIREHAKAVPSNSEARRLIQQGGIKIDGQAIDDVHFMLKPQAGQTLQVGKKKWFRLLLKS